jgi:hypothetical protein
VEVSRFFLPKRNIRASPPLQPVLKPIGQPFKNSSPAVLSESRVQREDQQLSVEDKFIRRKETKEKARRRKRGPYRKASSGRLIKY